jgi:hypothetical protein
MRHSGDAVRVSSSCSTRTGPTAWSGSVHDAATWPAGWAQGIFTFDQEWARVVPGYGLAAVVYLFVGHAVAMG